MCGKAVKFIAVFRLLLQSCAEREERDRDSCICTNFKNIKQVPRQECQETYHH